ncbi:peptide-N-glycosidase F-related protein [Winogradskyella sp. 3972H.M.0a.05]|uniref:peptide-N-glycosidase F-related protein n=1 Tax=Winogradskyella sp. 3972H.M.0a.05 TaxID=2950277 RepID=UPI003394B4CD
MKPLIKNRIAILFALFSFIVFINCSSDSNPGPSPTPSIAITGSIAPFGEVDALSHSSSQSFQVSGSDLTGTVTVTASDNFQVSLNDTSFSGNVSISSSDVNSGNTTVYVRFSPTAEALGFITGTVSIQSSGATTATLNVNGVALSIEPAILVNNNSLSFEDTQVSNTSASTAITVDGNNLESGIQIDVSEGFEISSDDMAFSNSMSITAENANDVNTIYVRFAPTTAAETNGTITIQSNGAETVEVALSGLGLPIIHNYQTYVDQPLGFGGGFNQSAEQTFTLHSDVSNIEQIKMYLQIDCPGTGCDDWDRYANIMIKDPDSNTWYEIGRYITPYWVGTQLLERGLEFDVTDFKSLLTGSVEIRIFIENWTAKADLVSIDFDYIEGEPDYPYYAIADVMQYNGNSLQGVPYGVSHAFDLDRTVSIPANAESTHLRTVISGWGHATPTDADGRPCAEWCFRTHDVIINGGNMFQHNMGPIGCAANPISNQNPGNWQPNRAGWCPGMVVPYRIDEFSTSMAGGNFTFEYDFEDWTSDGGNGDAYYAISTFVVVKSSTPIDKPTVMN